MNKGHYYIGQQIGNLEISSKYTKKSRYNVTCICGTNLVLGSRDLKIKIKDLETKGQSSCGKCSKQSFIDNRTNVEKFRYVYNTYKKNASTRNYKFELSREEFTQMILSPCFYCGTIESNSRKDRLTSDIISYNGVDRVDNTGDYTIDNTVACCRKCNIMKLDNTSKDFLEHVNKIAKYNVQRLSRRGVGSSDPKQEDSNIQLEYDIVCSN